jgi:hypothetical protein
VVAAGRVAVFIGLGGFDFLKLLRLFSFSLYFTNVLFAATVRGLAKWGK